VKAAATLAVLLGACMSPPDPEIVTLPSDAYFSGIAPQYSSPEACLAQASDPRACTYEIALCADGDAGLREGDVVTSGAYRMDGQTAIITVANRTFRLDVDSGLATGTILPMWTPDTQRWKTQEWDVISCTPPI